MNDKNDWKEKKYLREMWFCLNDKITRKSLSNNITMSGNMKNCNKYEKISN